MHLSPPIDPPILKGIKVHPDNPFRFDFILNKGDRELNNDQLMSESNKLIKYFLASLTTPEKDLWVNLSPYEKDRIIPNSFGLTEMGRDLLAEDYMLKQITASLIYPEDEVGKRFWKRVYAEASKRYGTTDIPVNTFNKVWIVPQKAVVYENAKAGTAYVVESKLKVMLEQDYLSLEKHEGIPSQERAATLAPKRDASTLGSQIIREVVIPELTTEINNNKNFARLRQVYNSLILATWYKKKIKDSILAQVYTDKNKVSGVNISDPQEKEKIYRQYLKAFKKGVYNYIKEDTDPITQEIIPRKYFSGGIDWEGIGSSEEGGNTILSLDKQGSAGVKFTEDLSRVPDQESGDYIVGANALPSTINAASGEKQKDNAMNVTETQLGHVPVLQEGRQESFIGSAWINAGRSSYRVWVQDGKVKAQRYDRAKSQVLDQSIWDLSLGQSYIFGRNNNAPRGDRDVLIDNDDTISARHFSFRVVKDGQDRQVIQVNDLNSSNGTSLEWLPNERQVVPKAGRIEKAFVGSAWINAGRSSYRVGVLDGKVRVYRYDREKNIVLDQNLPALELGRSYIFGRNNGAPQADRDFLIDNDILLSGRHFSFKVTQDAQGINVIEVNDLNSSNGTSLELTPIERQSVPRAGGIEKAFVGNAWVSAGGSSYRVGVQEGKVRVLRYDREKNIVLGQNLPTLELGRSYIFGRNNGAPQADRDFLIDNDILLSGRHFSIRVTQDPKGNNVIEVYDLNSSNGTQLAWTPVSQENTRYLDLEQDGQKTITSVEIDEAIKNLESAAPQEEAAAPSPVGSSRDTVVYRNLLGMSVREKINKYKSRIRQLNGYTGLRFTGTLGRLNLEGQAGDSDAYKNIVKATQFAINYLFSRSQSQRDDLIARSEELSRIQTADGYHKFDGGLIPAREAIFGENNSQLLQSLPAEVQAAFENGDIRIEDYLDGDLMRDVIGKLGGKSGRDVSLLDALRQYFTLIYKFENARNENELENVLGVLNSYKSYKFSKVTLGRQKVYMNVNGNWELMYNEEKGINELSPKTTTFQVVSRAYADSLQEFVDYVQSQSEEAQRNNFYIFNKIYEEYGYEWMVAARNGKIELYYPSQTYSKIAGQKQWSRQEAALGYLQDGKPHLKWFAKPKAESAHDVSDSCSLKINELLNGGAAVSIVHVAQEDVARIHIALGILFGFDGKQIIESNGYYGSNGTRIDHARYVAWRGFSYGHADVDQQQLEKEERHDKEFIGKEAFLGLGQDTQAIWAELTKEGNNFIRDSIVQDKTWMISEYAFMKSLPRTWSDGTKAQIYQILQQARTPEPQWLLPQQFNRNLLVDYSMRSERSADKAQALQKLDNGGIDLTPANMNLLTQNAGAGIKFHLDPALLAQLRNAPGFTPVIVNIQPMRDLKAFLGAVNDQSASPGASQI